MTFLETSKSSILQKKMASFQQHRFTQNNSGNSNVFLIEMYTKRKLIVLVLKVLAKKFGSSFFWVFY